MIPCPNCGNNLVTIIPKGTLCWNVYGDEVISTEDKRVSTGVCDKCKTMIPFSYILDYKEIN